MPSAHPPQRIGRHLLELGVAWKLQERAYGGLSPAMKRRLADLEKTMDEKGDLAKSRAVRLKPGAKLVREWRGQLFNGYGQFVADLYRGLETERLFM